MAHLKLTQKAHGHFETGFGLFHGCNYIQHQFGFFLKGACVLEFAHSKLRYVLLEWFVLSDAVCT
jgi:hypothetical protein